MRRFARELLVFVGMQLAIAAGVLWVGYDPNEYVAATVDNHQRLDALSPPRLILVGGSSMAFGSDSNLLERELNLRTVNLGLHRGSWIKPWPNRRESPC